MASSGESRVVWKCPECLRNFRLPKSKSRPDRCAKCAKKTGKASSAASIKATDDADEVFFQEAEPAKSSPLKFNVAVQQPVEGSALQPVTSSESAEVHSNTSFDELSARLDEVMEHLEGISRTMKLVRWVMWSIGFATVLSIVVTVAGLAYSMSLIGSLGSLLHQPGGEAPAGANRSAALIPDGGAGIQPQLQQALKLIEDQSKLRDELLNELGQ